MQQEQIDLGHKRTCPHCAAKYYDFYQDELECPQCGKSIEAVNITKPKIYIQEINKTNTKDDSSDRVFLKNCFFIFSSL